MSDPRGTFITFEGGEGSGKTSVMRAFAEALLADGMSILTTREPGAGTSLGADIRRMLLDTRQDPPTQWAEALLFAADRAQHVERVVRPALDRGEVVLCDRYVDSSVAYQGVARGLGADRIRQVSDWATGGLQPDWTVLLDVPVQVGLRRRMTSGEQDRLDRESVAFHDRVRTAFLSLAQREPDRFTVVDARVAPSKVLEQVLHAWRQRLSG